MRRASGQERWESGVGLWCVDCGRGLWVGPLSRFAWWAKKRLPAGWWTMPAMGGVIGLAALASVAWWAVPIAGGVVAALWWYLREPRLRERCWWLDERDKPTR